MWSHDYFEKTLRQNGYRHIAGVDEVGRGALAGPVLAAAVVFDGTGDYGSMRDSKTLSAGKRRMLAARIHDEAMGVSFGWI
jgi:ribonuclease HII